MKNRVLFKNSQSSIITTVLIVLVGLAAVAILAAFIINQVRSSVEDAQIKSKLTQMDISVAEVEAGNNYLLLKKNSNSLGVSIANISVIINGKKVETVADFTLNWSVLESKRVVLVNGVFNRNDIIEIYVISAEGSKKVPFEVTKTTVIKNAITPKIVILPKANGLPCINASYCLGGYCVVDESTQQLICSDGSIGSSCSENSDCVIDFCDVNGDYHLGSYTCAERVSGCTDSSACNYLDSANSDDGSCDYNCRYVYGCTDSSACNYNPSATVEDGTCEYNSCVGCTDSSACNYNPSATIGDGSCDYYSCHYGCTDSSACNYDPTAWWSDSSCNYDCRYGCTDSSACNYNSNAWWNDGSCEYNSCVGCTDSSACNYNPSATIGDGSCDYYSCHYGCTDSSACNYDPNAWWNDGSCYYSC